MTRYSRPGVEAAVRLASLTDNPSIWNQVLEQYNVMLAKKGGNKLVAMDAVCEELSTKLRESTRACISKEELIKIIEWKFAKGKPRPYMKYIKANTDAEVKECSKQSFLESDTGNIDEALDTMTKLKGVGIAGASTILSLYRPDLFAFMDDEIIECLFDGKRAYTKEIYLLVNEECIKIADSLGEGWTPRRVGMALWTAARISACGGEDLTTQSKKDPAQKESELTETGMKGRSHKRRKKS